MIKYRYHNIEVNSVEGFARIRGSVRNGIRDVCFVRMLGRSADLDRQVLAMDEELNRQMQAGRLFYRRIGSLPGLLAQEEVAYYTGCYESWVKAPREGIRIKGAGTALAVRLGAACTSVLQYYQHVKAAVTESMRKNLAVKLLYWLDSVCGAPARWCEAECRKIVAQNVCREQEYLFYYFLTLIGCDVLLLQSAGDSLKEALKSLSKEVRIGEFSTIELPQPCSLEAGGAQAQGKAEISANAQEQGRIVVKIPQRHRKQRTASGLAQPRLEKSFEELAALASSIVLILVHDPNGEVISTGSGIMVADGGYILTNDHVVRGGYSYAVRIENDDQVYQTDELIKYNPLLDLALLRIPRRLAPIPIYNGAKALARGQAVAAIGSPLGLFNSISDGIISGFRTIDGVDMIQFTAPISHGSSGGAVLNMYGEVIGISTAGFDRGQNINLAVGYESIRLFLQGFLGT